MVPKHLPALYAFPSSSIHSDDLIEIAGDTIGTPTRIVVSTEQLNRWEKQASEDPSFRQRLDKVRDRLQVMDLRSPLRPHSLSGAYIRDQVVYGFDARTKTIHLTSAERTSMLDIPETYPPSLCGMKLSAVRLQDTNSGPGKVPDRGGNLIALPDGTCLSAKGVSAGYVDIRCGPGAKRLEINGKYAGVGHADEIVNIVPDLTKKPPCDFAVLMGDTKLGLELLRKDPTAPFFDGDSLKRIKSAEAGNNCDANGGCNRVSSFCKVLDDVMYLQHIEDGLTGDSGIEGPSSPGGVDGAPSRSPAGASRPAEAKREEARRQDILRQERDAVPQLYLSHDRYKAVACERMTNKQALMAFEANSHFAKLRNWLDANAAKGSTERGLMKDLKEKLAILDALAARNVEFQKIQDENWRLIQSRLPPACRKDDVRQRLPTVVGGFRSLNPNPSNTQVIGKAAVFPRQFNRAFEKSMNRTFQSLGLRPRSTDSYSANAGSGNVHCTSNEIRVCR